MGGEEGAKHGIEHVYVQYSARTCIVRYCTHVHRYKYATFTGTVQ